MRGELVSYAQYNGMDDGVAEGFEDISHERPVAPVAINQTLRVLWWIVHLLRSRISTRLLLAAWKKGRKMCEYKTKTDGVCVSNAIAATCGTAISFLIGRELDKRGATMQPAELWAFLEETNTAALTHARAWPQDQILVI